jgi:hypothetical protein
MSSLHASRKRRELCTDDADIAHFPGLFLLSGYHTLNSENDYWSTLREDLDIPIVPTLMSRQKLGNIKSTFHVMDNATLQEGDKLGKSRPIYDVLRSGVQRYGVFHKLLRIDKSMVPYYAHHSCKMFIRAKPICFGYKI